MELLDQSGSLIYQTGEDLYEVGARLDLGLQVSVCVDSSHSDEWKRRAHVCAYYAYYFITSSSESLGSAQTTGLALCAR